MKQLLIPIILLTCLNTQAQTTALRLSTLESKVKALETKSVNTDSLQVAIKKQTDSSIAVLYKKITDSLSKLSIGSKPVIISDFTIQFDSVLRPVYVRIDTLNKYYVKRIDSSALVLKKADSTADVANRRTSNLTASVNTINNILSGVQSQITSVNDGLIQVDKNRQVSDQKQVIVNTSVDARLTTNESKIAAIIAALKNISTGL